MNMVVESVCVLIYKIDTAIIEAFEENVNRIDSIDFRMNSGVVYYLTKEFSFLCHSVMLRYAI